MCSFMGLGIEAVSAQCSLRQVILAEAVTTTMVNSSVLGLRCSQISEATLECMRLRAPNTAMRDSIQQLGSFFYGSMLS